MQTSPNDRGAAAGNVEHAAASFPLEEREAARVDVRALTLVSVGALLVGGGVGLIVQQASGLGHAVVALPFALALGLAGLIVGALRDRTRRRRLDAAAAAAPRVFVEGTELWVVEGEDFRSLLRLDRPFGATLFATPERDRLVLALTHRDGVEYLAARAPSGARHEAILARTVTTARSELPIAERMPTFERGDRLLDLVDHLAGCAGGALDRVWLSDAGMCDLVLDGQRLRAGELDFDLARPLRWRGYTFQEGSALATQSYQATALRQGEREIVLVSLAPAAELATASILTGLDGQGRIGPLALDSVQRALARDLRLARGLVDLPPPRALRVAIDRLFVPRLRAALDLAPPEEHVAPPRPTTTTLPSEALITPPEGMAPLRSSRP
jgi:hypothetical protein